jgi:RNA polymerase sigma-70 factor (ECF subfamily)
MSSEAPRDEFESGLKRLWLRAQAGDELACREALVQISGRLRSFFGRRLASLPDEVEVLVQETLWLRWRTGFVCPACLERAPADRP